MRKGFTLVELSIVLVIVGLLIGGVLIGQSLIESLKINKFINEMTQYERLIKTFEDTYRYYPGDMPNFGSWSGDGDGYLDNVGSPSRTAAGAENYLAWKHLSDARYLQEEYNGICASQWQYLPVKDSWGVVDDFEEGDTPVSKAFEDNYIYLRDWRPSAISGSTRYDHSLSMVLRSSVAIEDVMAIEKKIDDLEPMRGIIGGYNSSGNNCQSNGTTSYTHASLDLDSWNDRYYQYKGTSCQLYWRIDSLTENLSD